MRTFLGGTTSFVLVALVASVAEAQVGDGDYVSLDGQLQHRFEMSGDYFGAAAGETGAGVFAQGPDICWTTLTDGSRQPGNLLLYVGEVQCCLSVVRISDKLAFSKVWVQGTGFGYRVCTNQVFRKVGPPSP